MAHATSATAVVIMSKYKGLSNVGPDSMPVISPNKKGLLN
jgi:hypothetical protein